VCYEGVVEDEGPFPGRIPKQLSLLLGTFAGIIGAVVSFLAVADYLGGGWVGMAVTSLVFAVGFVIAFVVSRWFTPGWGPPIRP